MEKYTRQTAFNKAYLGLKAQGFERAYDEAYGCVYRSKGGSGRKCAFGHLIPDERYNPYFERRSVSYFFNDIDDFNDEETKKAANAIANDLFDPEDKEFLRDLQHCHDTCPHPDMMRVKLENFAFENNLTIPKEDSEQEDGKTQTSA